MAALDNSASAITTGRKVVAAAATAEQLSTDDTRILSVAVQAETDNTGDIGVGDSNVVAADGTERGVILEAGETVSLNVSQLSLLWVDATVSGDGVTWLALRP